MSRPNKPPKPQMPKPGTDDEYMNLFFSQTESPFSALNRELHEVEADSFQFVGNTNASEAASAPPPDQFGDDDQVSSRPSQPPPIPRPKPYSTNMTSPEPGIVQQRTRAFKQPIQFKKQGQTNQAYAQDFSQPPITQRAQANPGQFSSPHERPNVNDPVVQEAAPPPPVTAQQGQFDAEPFEPPFNPMQWMANVTSLGMNSDQPIDGSLQGVIMAVESFQKSVVDKMAFMRQSHAAMWQPEMWDTITRNVTARAGALQQTVASWREFDKACNDVERDLGSVAQQLNAVGELSVFIAGLQPQLHKLNSAGTTLARVEQAIRQSTVEFAVPVRDANRNEIRDKKAQLHMKFKSLRDRQQYQLAQAEASKRRIEHYQNTNAQIVSGRGEVATMIDNSMASGSSEGSNVIVQKIIDIEKKQQNYLIESRQFVQSSNIEHEKQHGAQILNRLQKDIAAFDTRTAAYFRHLAMTSAAPPVMTTREITQMAETNLTLEDSNSRKDNEIGELKSQIYCQEQLIMDLQHDIQSKDDLIAGLQGMVEEDGANNNQNLNTANENFMEAQRRIEELEVANKNYADLAEENRECSICNETRQTNQFKMFNPCGHRACEICIPNFNEQCPFCRTRIQSLIPFIPVNNT